MESPKCITSFIKAGKIFDQKEKTIIYYDKTHLKWIVQQELALFSLTKLNCRLEIANPLLHALPNEMSILHEICYFISS